MPVQKKSGNLLNAPRMYFLLSYPARLKLELKEKEKIYILTNSSLQLPSKYDVLSACVELKFESSFSLLLFSYD